MFARNLRVFGIEGPRRWHRWFGFHVGKEQVNLFLFRWRVFTHVAYFSDGRYVERGVPWSERLSFTR
jgi:hypothetical protein